MIEISCGVPFGVMDSMFTHIDRRQKCGIVSMLYHCLRKIHKWKGRDQGTVTWNHAASPVDFRITLYYSIIIRIMQGFRKIFMKILCGR